MVLNFPIMSDYHLIIWNNKKIFITHGHIYNKDNPLPLEKGDILLYGHFHIPMIIEENNLDMENGRQKGLSKLIKSPFTTP